MPSTYTLISANTLGSSAASVAFSAIPSTYTDLVIRGSSRSSAANVRSDFYILPNSETTSSTLGSRTTLRGFNGAAASARAANTFPFSNIFDDNGSSSTSNTFASWEIYLPSYTGSANKTFSSFGASEDNATNTVIVGVTAQQYRSSSAISSLTVTSLSTFVAGSSFYLYGISKS
jgi:hypothetical protein